MLFSRVSVVNALLSCNCLFWQICCPFYAPFSRLRLAGRRIPLPLSADNMEHNLELYDPDGKYDLAMQTKAPSLPAYKTPCKSTSTTTINIYTYTF